MGIALQMRDGSTRAVRMSEGLVFHLKQEWTPFVLSNAADVKGEDVLRILFYQDKKQIDVYKRQLFEMRAGLPKKEPAMLEDWEKNDLYNNLIKHNDGKPKFCLLYTSWCPLCY